MAHQSSNLRQVVQDANTLAWLSADSNEARELIVEAKLPARKVLIQERGDGRSVPIGMDARASAARAQCWQSYTLSSPRSQTLPLYY